MKINRYVCLFAALLAAFVAMSFISCNLAESVSYSTTSSDSSDDSSGTSSSSGYIYVALTHSGLSGLTLLSKKATIGGESVSSNGTGKSSYMKVNVSGRCSYSTYQSYQKVFTGGNKSTYNERTGGGTYTFSNGGKYTIDCKSGSVSKG